MTLTGRGSQTEDVSWWPKHSAWVKGGGYSGIWTPFQEQWFQRRLKGIYDGNVLPRNAKEWKVALKTEKKAGALADVVERPLGNLYIDISFRTRTLSMTGLNGRVGCIAKR